MSADFAVVRPSAAPAPLACRYLLVIHVPVVVDAQGRRWIERLWAMDLARHTDYIRDLTVACPFVHQAEPPPDSVPLPTSGLRFVEIAWPWRSIVSLLRAPLTAWQLWRLIGRYDVVHSIYGNWWPFATPYLVNLIARLRGKWLMVVVEASPWRVPHGERSSAWRRFKAWTAERLNRWTLSLADLVVFTHEGYRRDLMTRDPSRGQVIAASWIDALAVLPDADARALWQARLAGPGPLQLLFAGRLREDKGVRVLIEALRLLRGEAQTDVRVAVVGAGPLESACRDAAAESDARVRLELLAPVPYGEAFFSLLRRFHALLVPNLADEQPRIVFDAYSQALPVLGSATAGLAGCVRDGVTGRLFAPADPQALARTVREAATDPTALERLGLAALAVARSMTHQEMHRQRHVLIADALRARALA